MAIDENGVWREDQTLNEIRNRSSEEYLESKLETVWMTKGYSKNSVKEYVNHLLQELDYQKESFKLQIKEILDEKERLISEKTILSNQLEDTVATLNDIQSDSEKASELENIIKDLQTELTELKKADNLILIENLKTQLDEANMSINQLNEKLLNQQDKDIADNDGIYSELLDKIEFLQNENKVLHEEVYSLKNKSHDEITDGNDLEENEALSKINEALRYQLTEYERYKTDNKMLTTELMALSRLIKDLTERDKENEQKIDALQKTIEEKEKIYLEEIQTVSDNYDREIANLNEINKQIKAEIEDEKKQRSFLLNERSELQLRLSSCLEYLNELYDKVDYLQSSNKILSRQLEEQRIKNRMISGLDIPPLSIDAINKMHKNFIESEILNKDKEEITE